MQRLGEDGQGVPTPPVADGCRQVALGWSRPLGPGGRRAPRLLGGGCPEPGGERHLPSRAVCSVLSWLRLCSRGAGGGGTVVGGGDRVWGSGRGGGGDNCARAFAALPRPPMRVSRHRGLQRARQPRRSAGSSNSWTGSGWTEPEAPGPEGTAGGLPGAGCVFPRVRGFVLREVAPGLHSGGGLGGGRQPAPGTLWVSVGHGCRPAD